MTLCDGEIDARCDGTTVKTEKSKRYMDWMGVYHNILIYKMQKQTAFSQAAAQVVKKERKSISACGRRRYYFQEVN